MIAVVLVVLMLVLLAATPWRRLPMAGRFWAVAALLNTLVLFGMPTTPATSPWRPVVEWVLAASAATSLVLLVLGLILRQRHAAATGGGGPWAAPLIIGALPIVLYTFFLLTGPYY